MLASFGRLSVAMLALLLFSTSTWEVAQAAPPGKASKDAAKSTSKKKPSKRLSARAAAAKARAEARAKADAEAIAAGKAAVFVFDGDATDPVRDRVIRVLKTNGMRVQTDLRPTDTAEQFRDMAAALNLAIYVHGRMRELPRGQVAVTVTIRSGVTGRKIGGATFQGDRRELVSKVDEELWQKVHKPVARTCIDALKPRRHNAPMRIEAGTPIEDSPRRGT
jgi:hypothetical protein